MSKRPPFIDVVCNERLPEGVTLALVGTVDGSVTVMKDDGTTENLRGTKLKRFQRWTMRTRPGASK